LLDKLSHEDNVDVVLKLTKKERNSLRQCLEDMIEICEKYSQNSNELKGVPIHLLSRIRGSVDEMKFQYQGLLSKLDHPGHQ
jgi:hypothetical protein